MADEKNLNQVRNIFYRRNYPRLFRLMLFMALINLVMAALLIYLISHRPIPSFYATSGSEKNLPLTPLEMPIVSKRSLLRWANQAAISVYTFDFVNYQTELQKALEFFTKNAWAHFRQNIDANVRTIVEKKLRATAVATDAPVITEQGILTGRYSWRVVIPILITYESASERAQQRLLVNMLIERVSTLEKPRGIAIIQFYTSGGGSLLRR